MKTIAPNTPVPITLTAEECEYMLLWMAHLPMFAYRSVAPILTQIDVQKNAFIEAHGEERGEEG